MITLSFPLQEKGFRLDLIERIGPVCLVKRTRTGYSFWGCEVVKLRSWPDTHRFGTFYPAHETYPDGEVWGTTGFSYLASQPELARAKFKEMVEKLEL